MSDHTVLPISVEGTRLEMDEYKTEFEDRRGKSGFMCKVERAQTFAEPGNASWEAFRRGDWDESQRLIKARRGEWEDAARYYEEHGLAGGARVRVVQLPPTPYLQWELSLLRVRDEAGHATRIITVDDVIAHDYERHRQLPEVVVLDRVMYQVIYRSDGVADHALRYTGGALLEPWRDTVLSLWVKAEPIRDFWARELAELPPPGA